MAGEAATAEAFYAPLGTWFEVRAYPLEGAIAVFFRDVGEKKRHEEERDRLLAELRYEHTLLEGVLKQLPVGILVAEAPSGRILLHNDAARALLQDALPTEEGLPGLARLGVLHPDGRPYAPEDYALARALTKGEEIEREPVLYRHPDGGTTHLTVSAGPVRDAAGAAGPGGRRRRGDRRRRRRLRRRDRAAPDDRAASPCARGRRDGRLALG